MLGYAAGPGACQSAIWAGRHAGLGGEQGWTRKQLGPDLGVLAPPSGRPVSIGSHQSPCTMGSGSSANVLTKRTSKSYRVS